MNKYHLVMIRTLCQVLRKELARQCDVPQGHYVTLFVLLSSDWYQWLASTWIDDEASHSSQQLSEVWLVARYWVLHLVLFAIS